MKKLKLFNYSFVNAEEFNALPKKEKKMRILFDVMESILIGSYVPDPGLYVDNGPKVSIKNHPTEKCEVCALGSLFISRAKYVNVFTYCEVQNAMVDSTNTEGQKAKRDLEKIFGQRQLELIEYTFEGKDNGVYAGNLFENFPERYACDKFRYNYMYNGNYNDLLFAIVLNMISNNGIFKPEQESERI